MFRNIGVLVVATIVIAMYRGCKRSPLNDITQSTDYQP